jgi:putative pyruvate formate lyase activating enzyme
MPDFMPAYRVLLENGELQRRTDLFREQLSNCTLCPWQCGVDRTAGEKGQCQTGAQVRVYSYMAHHGEENPLRGRSGSGTIFFSGCNMHCQYCQNSDISQDNYGMPVSAEKLADMMLDLQGQGCHNINLVSPTHVVPQILEALLQAAREGLRLPLVYNTGGYDSPETLQLLEGIVDIYMPDMKYADESLARKYSRIPDYPAVNQAAVKEMHRQVGNLVLDEKGIAQRGLLIRHLLLPEDIAGTKEVIAFIADEISSSTYLNIMDQYRPDYNALDHPELLRRITREEYQRALDWACQAGLERLEP